MRTGKHCLTPLAAIAGGLLAGVVGTACLDTVRYLKYRRSGGKDSPLAWGFPPVDGWGGTYTGKEDVLGFFAGLPQRYGQWNLEPEEYIEAGDRLVVLGHHSFADGDRIPFAHAWTLRDARATRFEEYRSGATVTAPHE